MTSITRHTDELLTPTEVAEILGIKEATLTTWRYRGKPELPFIRRGRYVRYRRSDVDQFITDGYVDPATELEVN